MLDLFTHWFTKYEEKEGTKSVIVPPSRDTTFLVLLVLLIIVVYIIIRLKKKYLGHKRRQEELYELRRIHVGSSEEGCAAKDRAEMPRSTVHALQPPGERPRVCLR